MPNFAARDDAIAINSYATVLRRSCVPHEVFAHYWRDVHGPLCSRMPRLSWHVQHHFDHERDGHLWPAQESVGPLPGYVLDGMVEIGFANAADQAGFKDASAILFSDEQNVFKETLAYDLPQGSRPIVDRLPDPVPNGADTVDRIHVHLSAKRGWLDAYRAFVADDLCAALAVDLAVLKLRLHLPEPHGNAEPNPPAPDVDHDARQRRAAMAMIEVAFTDALARRRCYASDRFRATEAGQRENLSAATPFGVSGVFTYVRDGELTTAGLRGSRAAELIRRLGANNQVAPDVVHLMRTGQLTAG